MIQYRDGYKYQLVAPYTVALPEVDATLDTGCNYLRLRGGELVILEGYAWDGPSGPTIDTRNFMRGSLVHDALYQMMREFLLPISFRETADRILQRICIEDGMSSLRAWWVYRGVRLGGGPAAQAENDKHILVAP